MDKLVPALLEVGLSLNPAKCCVWGPGVCNNESGVCTYPEAVPNGHVFRLIPVTPFCEGFGITALGVPVDACGGSTHAAAKWESTTRNTLTLLEKLKAFPDAQIKHCLLRFCLDGCKVSLHQTVKYQPKIFGRTICEEFWKKFAGFCFFIPKNHQSHNQW